MDQIPKVGFYTQFLGLVCCNVLLTEQSVE